MRNIAKVKVKPLLVVSADSLDRVERISQTLSGEFSCRDFADVVGLMLGVMKCVSE